MGRRVLNVAAVMMTVVLLALAIGRAMPRGEQLLFSSSLNWQAGEWSIYMLDINRGVSQRLLTSRTDTMPGFPVVWSPDGRQIAYIATEVQMQTYLVDPQGQNSRRLTSTPINNEYNAAWSPDGCYLAFIGEGDNGRDVFVADAEGNDPRNLTIGVGSFRSLVWSPDSRYLALESQAIADREIYTLDIGTGSLINITDTPGNDAQPAWSPDSKQIAFLSSRNSGTFGNTRYDLYIMDQDGTNVRRYTYQVAADTTWNINWSPDGRRIIFGSGSWAGGADIFMIDVAYGLARNITRDSARDGSPVWSPDGQQVAFESRRTGNWEINLISADGWKRRQLTIGSVDSRRPVWSPDGKQIVYTSNPDRNWDLYIANVNDIFTRRITQTHSIDFLPVWRPSGG
jgi:Tol biopolymer transport system component